MENTPMDEIKWWFELTGIPSWRRAVKTKIMRLTGRQPRAKV